MRKNIFIIVGIVIVILIAFFSLRPNKSIAPSETEGDASSTSGTSTSGSGTKTSPKTSQTSKTSSKSTTQTAVKTSNLPEIDFINKRLVFPLKDFPDVKITVEQVVFGRGDAAMSTGCSGIPNADFSTYLYPGSGICLSTEKVDGSPRGIVALHILVENNGNIGFGGNSNLLMLHYLRSDSSGTPVHKFAYPIMGLGSYYVNGYSSKEMILSYLVPENQLVYDFVYGYKEPLVENKTLNVYDFSINGLQIDFGTKNIKIVK